LTGLRRELSLRDLVLFNIAAVTSIRTLGAAAHTGPSALWLWLGAALLFFVPSALCVAALSRRMPHEGGVYVWTREAFGPWHGFLCAYCYWLNNLFYFPSVIVAGVAMFAYAFAEDAAALSASPAFVLPVAVAVLWAITAANIFGLKVGKWLGNLGGAITFGTGFLLIALAAVKLVLQGPAAPLHFEFTWDWDKLNFWPQLAFAFGGLELGGIVAGEVRDPERTIPRASWLSGGAIALFYICGTVAILILMTPEAVSPVTGLTQAAGAAETALGLPGLASVTAAAIAIGLTGQIGAWMIVISRLPYVLGTEHFLPEAFGRLDPKFGSPRAALLSLSAACTFFLLVMHAGEDLRTGYQLLVDMAAVTYFIPLVYLFASAWKLLRLPLAWPGIGVLALGIALSFVPPGGTANVLVFEAKLVGGTAACLAVARLWFRAKTV
jgi:amino acid transporter